MQVLAAVMGLMVLLGLLLVGRWHMKRNVRQSGRPTSRSAFLKHTPTQWVAVAPMTLNCEEVHMSSAVTTTAGATSSTHSDQINRAKNFLKRSSNSTDIVTAQKSKHNSTPSYVHSSWTIMFGGRQNVPDTSPKAHLIDSENVTYQELP